jgi:hypothetical protein
MLAKFIQVKLAVEKAGVNFNIFKLIMRPEQVSVILNQEFKSVLCGHHTPVMLWGAPGIGKSQIISQAAAETLGGAEVISSKNKIPCLPWRFSSGNSDGIAQSTCSPFLKGTIDFRQAFG